MQIERFFDVLNVVNDELLIITAEISFISTEAGGRKTPAKTGYRPNHNFDEATNNIFYIGQIEFEREWLYPGNSQKAQVSFLNVIGLREKLTIGREWRIQEGGHLIGTGTIIKLVSSC